jgi:hypothetical protein
MDCPSSQITRITATTVIIAVPDMANSLLWKHFFGLYWSLFSVISRLDDDSLVSMPVCAASLRTFMNNPD